MSFNGKDFPSPRSFLPERKVGQWAVEYFQITEDEHTFTLWQALHRRDAWGVVPVGEYTRLVRGPSVVMSDTLMERDTCAHFVDAAKGHVLIGGLGLGMILPPILALDRVKSVTVIERNREVQDLVEFPLRLWVDMHVSPAASDKLQIIIADAFEWSPPLRFQWNTAIWDIWTDRSLDNLRDMTRLRDRWRKWVKGRQLCWFEQELKQMRDEEDY